ncbi:MAG: sialidase family protein [Thermoplasmata archaeon]
MDKKLVSSVIVILLLVVVGVSTAFYADKSFQVYETVESTINSSSGINWSSPIPIANSTSREVKPSITYDGTYHHVVYAYEYSSTDYDIIDRRSDDLYVTSSKYYISTSTENDTDPAVVYNHEGKEVWAFWSNEQNDIWYKVSYDYGVTWDGPWDYNMWDNDSDGKIYASSNSNVPSNVYTTFVIPADQSYTSQTKYVDYQTYDSGNGQGWNDIYSYNSEGQDPSRVTEVSSVVRNDGNVVSFWGREDDKGSNYEYFIRFREGQISSSISWGPVEEVLNWNDVPRKSYFCTAYDEEIDRIFLFYTSPNSTNVDIKYIFSDDGGYHWLDERDTDISFQLGNHSEMGMDAYITKDGGATNICLVYQDGSDDIYFVKGTIENTPPSVSNPSPLSGSVGVETNVTLSVDVSDSDGDSLNVTFYDASNDTMIGADYFVPSGGTAYANWTYLSHGEIYRWYVEVNDGMSSITSPTWNFTTYHITHIDLSDALESEGWNLVSCKLIAKYDNLLSILEDGHYGIKGNYQRVMYYSAASHEWRTYVPSRSEHFNDLTRVNRSISIWIKVNNSCRLSIEGTEPMSTTIGLHPGWNMVGYPCSTNQIASDVLPPEVSKIAVFNKWAPYNLEYIDDLSTEVLIPGRGYWLYNDADVAVNWTVEY